MSKTLKIMGLAAVMTFALCGCSGQDKEEAKEDVKETETDVKLSLIHI